MFRMFFNPRFLVLIRLKTWVQDFSTTLWKGILWTIVLSSYGMAQGQFGQTTKSDDIACKHPTYVQRPLAMDVRAASPFYAVAITRTRKTEQMDNVCYTYFEDIEPFLHIISIVYHDGSTSKIVLNKHGIEGEPGIAEAKGYSDACLFHDYTLIPVCNSTVFVLYRCFLCGDCSDLDIGPTFGVDTRVVLAAQPMTTPDCAGDIARSLSDTSELSGRQFLFLPNLLPPKCITTYTKPNGVTLQAIGSDKARATLLASYENRFNEF